MKSDERRSHRLNHLLRCYLAHPHEPALFCRAKQMGISDPTARDYVRTVILQAQRMRPGGARPRLARNVKSIAK